MQLIDNIITLYFSFSSFRFSSGYPQCGQFNAKSDIFASHSGQFIKAIYLTSLYIIPHEYNAVKSVIKGEGFSELGKLNQLKTIADNVIPNLSRGFLNLGRSVKSLVTHTGTFKDNIKAAGTNFKEFFSANKVTLFITAIMAIVAALNTITNAARETKEAIHEQYISDANKAAEQFADTKNTNAQLSEIIEKYKEIESSNISGVAKRSQLKSLQEELNNLVGTEAGAVDIVNGKLSTQLQTLKNI